MISAAVLGATGYAGQELVRLLAQHPDVELRIASTQSYGGAQLTDVFPHLRGKLDIACSETDIEMASDACDVVFIALPHGVSAKFVTEAVTKKAKIVDLGADFRLKDVQSYKEWYHNEHPNPELVSDAVYGLCEWNESKIAKTQLVANPGCYATAASLALLPLLANGIVEPSSIVVDAKSGVSGAGRVATQAVHFNECNETIKAYGLASHRHTPEIEEQLSQHAGSDVRITFTPHLVPMNRGILVTAYGTLKKPLTIYELHHTFNSTYKNKPFIRLFSPDATTQALPETRWVKGSNYCDIGYAIDERTGRAIVVAALDNLVKGAAGQAIQNMNIMFGLDQTRGLNYVPLFPA